MRLPSWVPTPANRRADRARRAVWDFVDGPIADRRSAADSDGGDLLSLLLTAPDPERVDVLDDRAVRDQAMIFLLAGHETTGATLAFALHLLGHHEEVQQRARQEVNDVASEGPDRGRTSDTPMLDVGVSLLPGGDLPSRQSAPSLG